MLRPYLCSLHPTRSRDLLFTVQPSLGTSGYQLRLTLPVERVAHAQLHPPHVRSGYELHGALRNKRCPDVGEPVLRCSSPVHTNGDEWPVRHEALGYAQFLLRKLLKFSMSSRICSLF